MVVKNLKSFKPKAIFSFVDLGIIVNTLLLILGSGFILYYFQDQFNEIGAIRFNSTLGALLFYFTMTILVFKLLFFIFLLVNFLRYKPIASVKDDELPTKTSPVPNLKPL